MLELYHTVDRLECGIDEAGRGALAGPVVAAAVVWGSEHDEDWDEFIHEVKDSKLVPPNKRNILAQKIKDHALDWSITFIDPTVIDEKNILEATYDAMHQCVDQLKIPVDHILVDGNRFRKHAIPHTCVVKGDNKYISIAAASILAKTARDEYMETLAKDPTFSMYHWDKNLGYGTQKHMEAIATYGPSIHHRMSFRLTKES